MGETLRLNTADGHELEAYIAQPKGKPRGGLVVCQEIHTRYLHMRNMLHGGFGQYIVNETCGFADAGYLAIAPILFDRAQDGTKLGEDGKTIELAFTNVIDWTGVIADVDVAAKAVANAGPVGVVGYGWGGSAAWLAACRLKIGAAVGYCGRKIYEHRAETPGCPVMLHFGEHDAQIPRKQVDGIRQLHPEVKVFNYPAGRDFNTKYSADFSMDAAVTAAERTRAFLAEHLR